ncbi:hypothetical protein Hanom_Chr06g00557961 [Helianthus anomalus]
MAVSNFRLPITKFFLDILDCYQIHISQMHLIGMVRVRHFVFVCRSMHIELSVPRFRVLHQMHCSQGFYSFMQRASKKRSCFNPQSHFMIGNFSEGGNMATIPMKPDEELWYHLIMRNFVLPRENELIAQPAAGAGNFYHNTMPVLSNLGIGPKKKKRAPAATAAPKKSEVEKTQSSKAKNVVGEKKGTRPSSDSWCDYVVVSDSLEGLAPAVVRRPKPEPSDTADIPPSNPDDPIDLESSPEHLLRKKARKRKQTGVDVDGQPAKKVQKKITRRGNLDAFVTKPVLEKPNSHVSAEPSFVVNKELPPSPSRTPANESLESTEITNHQAGRTVGTENSEAGKSADVVVDAKKITSSEAVDIGAGNPQTPESVSQDSGKGKTAQEIPVTMSPSTAPGFVRRDVEKNAGGNQSSFIRSNENSPIRPNESPGDYYYRCYSEKQADEVHMLWLKGTFPPGEIKFQEGPPHEQTYHSYLEEATSYTSSMHHIVREWHSMHKEWASFKSSKKKAAEDEAQGAQLRAKLEAN